MKIKTLTLIVLCTFTVSALLAVPSTINYQGLIADVEGTPIESATNSISVGLFATELDEAILYTESFSNVNSDAHGVYSIQIGDSNLQALLETNSELWLELTINGETLTPRQQVHSVPYALHAESANRLVNADDSSISGDLSVSGNSALSGNVSVSNTLSVSGESTFSDDIDVQGRIVGEDARFYHLDVLGHIMTSDIHVHGDLEVDGYRANFEYAEEVRVPTPDQANEATNKAYVDNAVSTAIASDNARGLVQLAIAENVTNLNEYYLTYQAESEALNPAQGDLILLTGQTTASENGIYEVSSVGVSPSYTPSSEGNSPSASDYYVSLARASNFDTAEEFITGSFVFVEKGDLVGQGYVLGELASDFILGTSPINYVQFTIDTASDVAFDQQVSANSLASSGDLSVSGNSALSGNVSVSNTLSVSGESTFSDDIDVQGRIVGEDARFHHLDVHGDLEVDGYRANFEYAEEVRVPTPDQANEATNKAYVDSADGTLQANIDNEALARADGDNAITSGNTVFTGNPSFTGAKALPSGQTDWSSQYHELMPWNMASSNVPNYATADVSGLFNADVINAEKMLRVGNMYITEDEIRSDYGMVNLRDARVDGMLEVRGDLEMDGYRANFEYAGEVRVPTPDQANEATNKAYVDSLVTYEKEALQADIDQNEADADAAIATLQADVDQNEADVDAAIAASPAQVPVLFAMEWHVSNKSSVYLQYYDSYQNQWVQSQVGDRVLLAGQDNASENGIYTVQSVNGYYASLARAEDYDSSEEINAGDFVFVLVGDLAGQGFILEAISEAFELGVDALNFSRFTVDTTQDVEFQQRVIAEEFRVMNPGGMVELNGGYNYIGGNLDVSGDLSVAGALNFENAPSVRVPTPDQANEATNKAYVDSAVSGAINASSLTTSGDLTVSGSTALSGIVSTGDLSVSGNSALSGNVSVSNTLSVSGESTFSDDIDVQGRIVGEDARFDYIDVMGHVSASNVDASEVTAHGRLRTYGDLEMNGYRANFENAEEVLVPTPDQANEAANKAYVDSTDSALQADIDQNEADADTAIANLQADVDQNELDADAAIAAESVARQEADASLQADIDQNEADADADILTLQLRTAEMPSQEMVDFAKIYNESNLSNVWIATLDYNTGQTYSCEVGDLVLLTNQANPSENGIYEIESIVSTYSDSKRVSLTRAADYNSTEEIHTGDFILVQKGEANGLAYMLGTLVDNFELGVDPLNWYRCGINTSQDIQFQGRVEAGELRVMGPGGEVRFDGYGNYISSYWSTYFDGWGEVHFENSGGVSFSTDVIVPTPDQANEATNKAYVDSVVVPSGGLIAWPATNPIPAGWSDPGLAAPMADHIWIQKN